ncbi:MAG: prephenate dehydrogenase/arogenate dehydrogenase family protein, partial [Nitrospirota bacterium]
MITKRKRDTGTRRHGDTSPLQRVTESPSRIFFNRVTILGVGLIGASFALALKKHGLCKEVIGCGRGQENLRRAKEKKIIDSFELDSAKACEGSDLVLFATPVGSFVDIAKRIRSILNRG